MKIAKSIYTEKRNKNSRLVIVSLTDLFKAIHDLDYCKSKFSRINGTKKFWNDYKEDNRWIDNQTGERSEFNTVSIQAPEIYYEKGQLKIANGRHRIIGLDELGYTHVECEL